MSAKRTRAVLLAAFAISLLLHAILAGYFHWPFELRSHEEQIAQVRIIHIGRVTPRPSPPPTPVPPRIPKPKVLPPAVTPTGKGGAVVQRTPVPLATATPLVRPTPKSSPSPAATIGPCNGHLNADPAVLASPDPVPLSPQARASKAGGIAQIRVTLDQTGRVTQTAVAQTSGNAGLDDAAAQMARNATYSPKYVQCKAVAGEYVFSVKFAPW